MFACAAFQLFEDTRVPLDDPDRFVVRTFFSPGVSRDPVTQEPYTDPASFAGVSTVRRPPMAPPVLMASTSGSSTPAASFPDHVLNMTPTMYVFVFHCSFLAAVGLINAVVACMPFSLGALASCLQRSLPLGTFFEIMESLLDGHAGEPPKTSGTVPAFPVTFKAAASEESPCP